MPDGWEDWPPEQRYVAVRSSVRQYLIITASHKFSTVLSIDGSHSLQKKAKNDDPDDISLNEGRGYFVQDGPFHTFLKECGYVEEVSVTARAQTISLMSGDAEKHL